MKKRSCACNLAVQVSLCIIFYLALNLGKPQKSLFHSRGGLITRPVDVFFLSVNGGYRPFQEQNRLLKLMESVARVYKAKFIVNISELGEDDPLTRNGSRLFSAMNVPWYTAGPSKDQKVACFIQQINITHGKMLTIAGVDTELLQDVTLERSMESSGNNQSNWLTQTLESAAGNWLILVGHRPVVICEENEEQNKAMHVYEPVHQIFVKYGLDAYLSRQGCNNDAFLDSVAYIGITDPIKSEQHLAASNGNLAFQMEMDIGFLLHRVSYAEITTYFVTLSGDVVNKIVIQQKGKEVM